jgi:hypothetical protein
VPLPEPSLAARRDPSISAEIGFVHPKGVWVGNEEVNEMTVLWRKRHKPKKTQKRGLSGFASNRKCAILRFGRGIK